MLKKCVFWIKIRKIIGKSPNALDLAKSPKTTFFKEISEKLEAWRFYDPKTCIFRCVERPQNSSKSSVSRKTK